MEGQRTVKKYADVLIKLKFKLLDLLYVSFPFTNPIV
jgi:hypothetical protein